MNTPAFLLAAAALFWGSQTGNWLAAVAVAVLLEAPRYFKQRWNLENAEFYRVSDFCTVLLAGIGIYLYFTFGNPRAITLLFQWMPMILAPLALAQAWSTSREIDLAVLFYSLRRNPMRRPSKLNLGYPAFALLLVAASAANSRSDGFYVGLAALIAWPLYLARPRSYAAPLWGGVLLAAVLAGYAGHSGLHRLQQWMEGVMPEWIAGGGARTNPYRNTTDIGTIGELKQSERIVLRIETEPARPVLLHRASYDSYVGGTWVARNGQFRQLEPFGNATTWRLAENPVSPARAQEPMSIHDHSGDGNPVLSLPSGAARIEGLAASEMKVNALGAVQVEHKPGFFSFRVFAGPGTPTYGLPAQTDLSIPEAEAAAIAKIASELNLAALPPAQALRAVRQFFDRRFEYATWQKTAAGGRTPLAEFLLATHAGHCEYFATATVLLLRAAGIPARYATGFSAQEYSDWQGAYVVRERHAHAWARAWVGGGWQDVDTTPASWFAVESAQTPLWQPVSDLWSWVRFSLAQWSARAGSMDQYLGWLALPLAFWLGWRTLRGRRAEVAAPAAAHTREKSRPGQDSEFYLVERRAAELGHARPEAEALSDWLNRIRAAAGLESEALQRLARLHYRYRFDPAGLPAHERESLREQALAWLARHPATTTPQAKSR